MRIDKIASSAEYRIDKQFQNLPILGAKFWFSKLKKNSRNFLIFQIAKFSIFINYPIRRNPKMSNLEKSKNFQYGKFRKFPKFYNFEYRQISIIAKFIK